MTAVYRRDAYHSGRKRLCWICDSVRPHTSSVLRMSAHRVNLLQPCGTNVTTQPHPLYEKAMILFHEVSARLAQVPCLHFQLQYTQVTQFFSVVHRLSSFITLKCPRTTIFGRPALPAHIRSVMCAVLSMSMSEIDALWEALGDLALQGGWDEEIGVTTLDRRLSAQALQRDIGM